MQVETEDLKVSDFCLGDEFGNDIDNCVDIALDLPCCVARPCFALEPEGWFLQVVPEVVRMLIPKRVGRMHSLHDDDGDDDDDDGDDDDDNPNLWA